MKKFLVVLTVLALCPIMAMAETIGDSIAFDASVALTGGTALWTANIKDIATNGSASSVAWTGANPGDNGYKVADHYIVVEATVTTADNWQMIIYTNNTNYTGDTSTVAANGYGLVGTDPAFGLPVCWRVQDDLGTPSTPVFSLDRPDSTEGFTDYQWKFVEDQTRTNADSSSAWDANSTYVRVWDRDSGLYWSENPAEAGPPADDSVYIYLGADFTNSIGQTYSTSSLTLEMMSL